MALLKINRQKAIEIMENNLRILKEETNSDTFLVLSYDLEKQSSLGKQRLDMNGGIKLIDKSKTLVLNEDEDEEEKISVVSMYTAHQKDIYCIMPIGEKHDMIIIPQLEQKIEQKSNKTIDKNDCSGI